jgi:hypothetical protein
MQLYALAGEAWTAQVRRTDHRAFEAVASSPALEDCEPARQLGRQRMHRYDAHLGTSERTGRAIVLEGGIALLWRCARERTEDAERVVQRWHSASIRPVGRGVPSAAGVPR